MIYTKWGDPIEIRTRCGTHEPEGFTVPVRLAKVVYKEENSRERFWFIEFLRANGGLNEIEAAYNAANEQELSKEELAEAFRQAA